MHVCLIFITFRIIADRVPNHPGTTSAGLRKNRFKNMVVSVSSPPKDLYTLKATKNNVKWAALLGCNDLQSDVLDGTPLSSTRKVEWTCKVAYCMVRHFASTKKASLPSQVAYHPVGRLGSSRKATLTSQSASHPIRQGH